MSPFFGRPGVGFYAQAGMRNTPLRTDAGRSAWLTAKWKAEGLNVEA